MKTYFIISLCLAMGISCAVAQVTIGSSIPPSKGALLDLKEFNAKDDQTTSTKGLALPRVKITDLNSLSDIEEANSSNPKVYTGLIVYMPKQYKGGNLCTGTVEIPQALYVWTGSKWTSLGELPIEHSVVDPSEIVDKGIDGNISWLLKKDGQLMVCGDGPMRNYITGSAPWMQYSSHLRNIFLDEGITTIGHSAFENCSGFTGNLIIPNSVTTIGKKAFWNCTGFTGDLIIPNSVTTIEHGAFQNCSGFTGNLIIPNSVTTIEDYAFWNCTGFTGDLIIPNLIKTIAYNAFNDCTGFTGNLIIPNSVTTIKKSAFKNCSGFTGNLIIPNSVTTIENLAFYDCYGFTGSLNIPNSVTTIGERAFYNCYGFTDDLNIPKSVKTIEIGAFQKCTGLNGILTIPNTIETIEKVAFANIPLITTVNCYAPSSVFVGDGIFSSNNSTDGYIYDIVRDMHIPSSNASDYPQAIWSPMNITIKADLP